MQANFWVFSVEIFDLKLKSLRSLTLFIDNENCVQTISRQTKSGSYRKKNQLLRGLDEDNVKIEPLMEKILFQSERQIQNREMGPSHQD